MGPESRLGLSKLRQREKILLFGGTGTSKTYSLISLALSFPDNRLAVIDPDDGFAKVLDELGGEKAFPNIDYYPAHTWDEIYAAYIEIVGYLGQGDWLGIEKLGKLWDSAQNYYSAITFSETAVEHLLGKIEDGRTPKAGGFEGETEWPVIKRLHNELVVDDMVARHDFNVFATAEAKELTFRDREAAEKSKLMRDFLAIFAPVGVKPEGEKHNAGRFDTIAYATTDEVPGPGGKRVSTYSARVLRDRGRTMTKAVDLDTTNLGFWGAYKELL